MVILLSDPFTFTPINPDDAPRRNELLFAYMVEIQTVLSACISNDRLLKVGVKGNLIEFSKDVGLSVADIPVPTLFSELPSAGVIMTIEEKIIVAHNKIIIKHRWVLDRELSCVNFLRLNMCYNFQCLIIFLFSSILDVHISNPVYSSLSFFNDFVAFSLSGEVLSKSETKLFSSAFLIMISPSFRSKIIRSPLEIPRNFLISTGIVI